MELTKPDARIDADTAIAWYKKNRARTYAGIADAMAEQWGGTAALEAVG